MATSKLLTVFGGTGVQGGSVIEAVLSHPVLSSEYKIRAITRDPSKPSAQKLGARGVETVRADTNDVESLKHALEGSYAVYAVTNYWENMSKSGEIQQGKNIANAAKDVGVKHLIWSALPHVSKLSGGKLKSVEHFDSKAEVAEYIETMKGDMTASYFMPGFYMQNIKGMIKPGQDDIPTFTQPWVADETQVALLDAAADTGKYVAGLLAQNRDSVNGIYVNGVSQWLTPNEIVHTLSKTSGTEVKFQQVPEETFQSFLPPSVAQEMTENMVLVRDFSYFGKGEEKNQARSDKVLGEQTKTSWEDFVKRNGPWNFGTDGKDLYKNL